MQKSRSSTSISLHRVEIDAQSFKRINRVCLYT